MLSTLEQSLWPALEQRVKFRVAGRTDAGVSATGQIVVMDVASYGAEELVSVNGDAVGVSGLAAALNTCLPADLRVTEVVIVPKAFDAGRDCRWKRYRYRLPPCQLADNDDDGMRVLRMVESHVARAVRQRAAAVDDDGAQGVAIDAPPSPPRRASRRRRGLPPLAITDVAAMRRAAAMLEGTHDFGAFTARGGDQKGTVRTIFRCAVEPRTGRVANESTGDAVGMASVDLASTHRMDSEVEEEAYDIVVEGDGFLYKQVRIIAGTLLMVGMGLAPPETVLTALSSEGEAGISGDADDESISTSTPKSQLRSCGVVGPTLPPERLCLEHIEYDHTSV